MSEPASPLDRIKLRRSFERAAAQYDATAVLQREIADRMLDRLDYVRVDPRWIVDLGTGTGYCARALLQRYTKASVIAVDLAWTMARAARKRRVWLRRPLAICADAAALPLDDGRAELVFSNLMLQWCLPLDPYFAEIRRVMAAGGLLLFSTFGPDTLRELRQAWGDVDTGAHVHPFIDMHDVGDELLRAGFADPVMDMERITLTYADVLDLMRDLKGIGASNAMTGRAAGLTGAGAVRRLRQAYERFRGASGRLPATYEVVYGHAWVPAAPAPSRLPERWIAVSAGER
ncbi:MAG: malonyl-ACP O-methyltransferase BioC [Thiotrichales bacterium]